DFRDVRVAGRRAVMEIELFVIVIIAVNYNGEPLPVGTHQLYYFISTAVEVPGDKGYCGVKVCLLHLRVQVLKIQAPVRFYQPWIINRQIGEMIRSAPLFKT